jgi:hypothetical protein
MKTLGPPKECKSCNPPRVRPLSDFYKRKSSPDGHSPICKECESKKHAEYYKRNKSKRIHRRSKLKVNYNLTEKDFDTLFEEQEGACAICKRADVKLVVDHDHTTGAVRGLLCNGCNHGLGRFGDSIPLMESAIAYLEKHLEPPTEIESDGTVAG